MSDHAMLPNHHHPGPRCSCRECQRQYPDPPTSNQDLSRDEAVQLAARAEAGVTWPRPGSFASERSAFMAGVRFALARVPDETKAGKCSSCDRSIVDPDPSYCPHCGAAFGGRFHVQHDQRCIVTRINAALGFSPNVETSARSRCASCGHEWTEDTVWCPKCAAGDVSGNCEHGVPRRFCTAMHGESPT